MTRSPSAAGDHRRVVGERLGGGPLRPAAAVLQRLRQVPVVERDERPDPGLEEAVDEPVVEVQPGRVDPPDAVGITRGQATENR